MWLQRPLARPSDENKPHIHTALCGHLGPPPPPLCGARSARRLARPDHHQQAPSSSLLLRQLALVKVVVCMSARFGLQFATCKAAANAACLPGPLTGPAKLDGTQDCLGTVYRLQATSQPASKPTNRGDSFTTTTTATTKSTLCVGLVISWRSSWCLSSSP